METERKWLVSRENIPYNLDEFPSEHIIQRYISFSPTIRIRDINDGAAYILTVKSSSGGLSREEFELPLTAEQYRFLSGKTEGHVIDKTRYSVYEPDHKYEIDIFHGELEGLIYLEIEFDSEEEAEEYPSPKWAGRDVSYDKAYSNAALAKNGLGRAE